MESLVDIGHHSSLLMQVLLYADCNTKERMINKESSLLTLFARPKVYRSC
jgi:hypothetical protein